MKAYVVQSGPLKITIVADCPREAALEAVACWQDGEERPTTETVCPTLVQPELIVRRRGQRALRHYSAVRMLAQLRGQNVTETWKELLARRVGCCN
jgi:hypothetical protein